MKKNYFIVLILAILFAACSKESNEELVGKVNTETLSQKGTGAMVILHQANLETPAGTSSYKAVGFIKVKNVAYTKQVIVRYRIASGAWVDASASYFTTLDDGNEIWKFATASTPFSRYNMPVIEFCFKYHVNGVDYWDNNSGNNYKMYGGVGYEFVNDFLLGGETMVDAKVLLQGGPTTGYSIAFWGYVQNIAYSKEVTLVYTTDNWVTSKRARATYAAVNPGQPNVEIWKNTNIPLTGFVSGTTKVQAAVVYKANGVEMWDNNFKKNYILQ